MILPRRDFLRLLGVATAGAGLAGCGRQWSVPDQLVAMAMRGPGLESHVQTVCGLCEGGCGLTVRLVDGLPVGLKGNLRNPLNGGGLCPVGQSALEVLYAPERVQGPLRRQSGGSFQPAAWDEALEEIAGRIGELRTAGQADRIALLSAEPSAVFHDLARRFVHSLDSTNIAWLQQPDTTAYRLCQGQESMAGYDLSQADLVLSLGHDIYEDGPAPLHAISSLVGTRPAGSQARLLYVGTRQSPSATKAERRVTIQPGTHGAFALGVAHVLVREARFDRQFVADHTFGFEDFTDRRGRSRMGFRRLLLERYYPDRVAQLCGCDPMQIIEVARRFSDASAPLALAGREATRSTNGTWSSMAAHSLNALVGAFNRPGGVTAPPRIPLRPLVPLPQPSADNASSISMPESDGTLYGIDPVEALASGVRDGSRPIELLILVSTNPVLESPAGGRLREAMDQIPMVVALAPFQNETTAGADYLLPSPNFLESWQCATTPPGTAFGVLGLGKPILEPLHDTRHPGDVLLELSRRIDDRTAGAAPWSDYSDYLRDRIEGIGISGQGSAFKGAFEESWVRFLEERGWRFNEHEGLEDFWSDVTRHGGWWNPGPPSRDWGQHFATASGRFEFFSNELDEALRALGSARGGVPAGSDEALRSGIEALQLQADEDEACLPHFEAPREMGEGEVTLIPFQPITARGSLISASPMIQEMFGYTVFSGWQTWAELSPVTAEELGVEYGDRIALESDVASIEAVVRVQPGAAAGVVHVPIGLGHNGTYGSEGRVGAAPIGLIEPMHDPISGSLSLTESRVRVRRVRKRPHGGPPPAHGGHDS
jgi:anaerobic selenocysteine-containing dehydrogenase